FGEAPKGILIFTPDGRFAQIHVASDVPKIGSGNRLTGTAEENAAILHRSLALFGSYTVDEEKKTVTFNIVSSTFPNWQGEAQTRTIDKLTADEFVNVDYLKDLVPIAMLGRQPQVLGVHPSFDVKSVAELVSAVKQMSSLGCATSG